MTQGADTSTPDTSTPDAPAPGAPAPEAPAPEAPAPGAPAPGAPAPGAPASGRAIFSWCLFDWANSAYPTVITTFVFATYFTEAIAVTPEQGTALMGWTLGASGLVIAFLSPFLGAVADRAGRRKPWLLFFTALCVLSTGLLWYARPEVSWIAYALILIGVSNTAFEFGVVFNNAMLPDLSGAARLGRISGWAWGLGYVGGLSCLVVALFGFVQPEESLFGIGKEDAAHIRATALLVAVWFAIFSVPLFLFTPDRVASAGRLFNHARAGFRDLLQTLASVREHRNIALFLLAHMLYADGLVTLFAFGGIYAAGTFGMDFEAVIIFAIAINAMAGLGAMLFAWLDDFWGSRPVIATALVGLIASCAAAVATDSITVFWICGLAIGVFAGPVQAASRTLMARLAPAHLQTEMFGLFALSGKATAFAGPIVLGLATAAAGNQRAGMATILAFLVAGLVLLFLVREKTTSA